MKYISKTLGFLAVFCMFGGADAALRAGGVNTNAATSRVSSIPVNGTTGAARRLPTMILPQNVTSSSGSTSSDSSLMDMTECVDAYTGCIKGSDACGANFEECTTAELFYAKKPQCNSVLLQCSSAGVNALFGTTNTAYLSVEYMDTYPTPASVVGQFIAAGEINNRLDKSACVKRYMSCLKKDDVCGNDFELCTSTNEFRTQMIYCESTLARCTDEGKIELFGTTDTSSIAGPQDDSRLRIMITEGAALASRNAVSTCYRVADQCILSACSANPYKCIIDSSSELVCANDTANGVECSTLSGNNLSNYVVNAADVRKYLKSSCMNTIGGNKYCFMTINGGAIPTASDLIDEQEMEQVYTEIYALRMNDTLRTEIQNMAEEVDRETKDKCVETISSCAMRSCGGGVGSKCYAQVFGTSGNAHKWINQEITTYNEISSGCAAIVNTDPACQYAAASVKSYGASTNSNIYGYTYRASDTFTTLFPKATTNTNKLVDPIGVIEKLSGLLKANYSPAAIEKLGEDCKNAVSSCIINQCGSDFVKCYRNRTDIMTDTYDSGDISTAFANSMDKVGGVLDFTIVRGLCADQVSKIKACDEHLKIQTVVAKTGSNITSWGSVSSVGDAWNTAVVDGYTTDTIRLTDSNLCTVDADNATTEECKQKAGYELRDCNTYDEDGCFYNKEDTNLRKNYMVNMATNTLFREVLGKLEQKAQADYNAKLTVEQNMCKSANSGGIMGRNDMASTYMWAKLKSRKVPKNYSVNGLKESEFEKSNDLYGSFCRARVTIQSDDPAIQRYIQETNSTNWTRAYFAVGDVFTCGSWISQADLEKIATRVACEKAKAKGTLNSNVDCANDTQAIDKIRMTIGQRWATTAATLGSFALGTYGMDLLQSRTGLGGLLTTTENKSDKSEIEDSLTKATKAYSSNCGDKNATFSRTYTSTVNGKSLYSYSSKDNNGAYKCSDLQEYISDLETALGKISDNKSDWGRVGVDALVGGGAMALVGGLATGRNINAANRQQFTADQQEFMDNVGNHLYCFIGADEAGTYGDLIEISLD